MGVAILSTVAVSRAEALRYTLARTRRRAHEGFQSAFLACFALAGLGVLMAIALLGAPRGRRESGWSRSPRNEVRSRRALRRSWPAVSDAIGRFV